MALSTFDFEKPIVDIEARLETMRAKKKQDDKSLAAIKELEQELGDTRRRIYSNLSAYQRVLLARHQARPHSQDYINALTEEFMELHGDRGFADDRAAGLATAERQWVGRRRASHLLLGEETGARQV